MTHWQPKPLLLTHLFFALLLMSWYFFEPIWVAVDRSAFYFFNGFLDTSKDWQYYWAIANKRSFDVVPATLMLSVFLLYILGKQRSEVRKRITHMLIIGIFSLLVLTFSKKVLDFDRYSPSLQLEPVHRLTLLAPEVDTKDSSKGSFPGEHTMTLTVWVILFWYFAGWRFGLIALSFGIIFSIPRLVAGAHWLTDDIIGGMGVATLGCSWLIFTPALGKFYNAFDPIAGWLGRITRLSKETQH